MWCREYYPKKELWTGFCHRLRQSVAGSDKCHDVSEEKAPSNAQERTKQRRRATIKPRRGKAATGR